MIYLHLVHHHHFQTSPGIFWFQAQDVQPQWVPQWTRDMQKPGAIPLFSFFLQKLDEILLFCLWQKIWCGDSIVFNFILQKPGPILLFFLVEKNLVEFYCCCFLGVAKHAVMKESKHSFYPAGNSCEKPRKTCLESPRPRFLQSSPYY